MTHYIAMGWAPYENCWNFDYDEPEKLPAFPTRDGALAWASKHGYSANDIKVFEIEVASVSQIPEQGPNE